MGHCAISVFIKDLASSATHFQRESPWRYFEAVNTFCQLQEIMGLYLKEKNKPF